MSNRFKEIKYLEKEYKYFMQVYELLGHVKLVEGNYIISYENEQCFLPHYIAIKHSSTATNLRVFSTFHLKL